MAAPSLETLQRIAGDTGHQPAAIEKVLRLLDLLQAIADDEFLKTRLALKGGTALNAFYLQLDRLSVDIDLNYVGALERETMLAERSQVETALARLLAAFGYEVRRQPDEHAGGKWIAQHASALGGRGVLELDVNFMMREPLFGAARKDSATFGGATATRILVVDLHEVIAGKLVALLDRRAARDLFDARRIFETPDLNWRWIRAAMLAFGASGRNDFRKASLDAIGADPKELRNNLLFCLPRNRFPDRRSINAWIDDTVSLCRERLAPILDWTMKERDFLDGVIDQGVIDASKLDIESEIAARIDRMPMLQWKAQHVKQLKGRR